MTEAVSTRYITETFPGVSTDSQGNAFFFHGPARLLPFATLNITE